MAAVGFHVPIISLELRFLSAASSTFCKRCLNALRKGSLKVPFSPSDAPVLMCFFQHFANANQTHDENATGSGRFSHWFVLLEVTRAMQACKSTFYQTVTKLFMRGTIEVYLFS